MSSKPKVCLVSSSGGHYEQLLQLKKWSEDYNVFWVTEKTKYESPADYYVLQIGSNDKYFYLKFIKLFFQVLQIWIKEKPDYIVTTGALVAVPFGLIAKLLRRKIVFIESFARVNDSSQTGRLFYKIADLFIVQWKPLLKEYPNAVYGGSIY